MMLTPNTPENDAPRSAYGAWPERVAPPVVAVHEVELVRIRVPWRDVFWIVFQFVVVTAIISAVLTLVVAVCAFVWFVLKVDSLQ